MVPRLGLVWRSWVSRNGNGFWVVRQQLENSCTSEIEPVLHDMAMEQMCGSMLPVVGSMFGDEKGCSFFFPTMPNPGYRRCSRGCKYHAWPLPRWIPLSQLRWLMAKSLQLMGSLPRVPLSTGLCHATWRQDWLQNPQNNILSVLGNGWCPDDASTPPNPTSPPKC